MISSIRNLVQFSIYNVPIMNKGYIKVIRQGINYYQGEKRDICNKISCNPVKP